MASNLHTPEHFYPEEKYHYQDKKIPKLDQNTDNSRKENVFTICITQQFDAQCVLTCCRNI